MLQCLLVPAKILVWRARTWSELSFSAILTLLDKVFLLDSTNTTKEDLESEMCFKINTEENVHKAIAGNKTAWLNSGPV